MAGGSEAAANALRYQIKVALFGVQDRDGNYKLLETSKTDEIGREPAERYWRQTETQFRELLDALPGATIPRTRTRNTRKGWLKVIKAAALRIFDEDIAPEEAWDEDPKRLVYARPACRLRLSKTTKFGRSSGSRRPSTQEKRGARAVQPLEHGHDKQLSATRK